LRYHFAPGFCKATRTQLRRPIATPRTIFKFSFGVMIAPAQREAVVIHYLSTMPCSCPRVPGPWESWGLRSVAHPVSIMRISPVTNAQPKVLCNTILACIRTILDRNSARRHNDGPLLLAAALVLPPAGLVRWC
jgi:hypothetical protein